MLWGFFKKLVIADRLSPYVDQVYSALGLYNGFSLILIIFFYAIQIYCDFSGYSDIAIGTAKLFGIDFVANFRTPYFSTTLKEFWAQWHMSLSTWFRDYIYIPLGGNRVSKSRHSVNLVITFLVSGLWHGANWTYIVWGGIHGVGQVVENLLHIHTDKDKKGGRWLFRALIVFVFTAIAWVFFRADSIHDALYIFGHITKGIGSPLAYLKNGFSALGIGKAMLIDIIVILFALFSVDLIAAKSGKNSVEFLNSTKPFVQWIVFIALACIILILSSKGVATEFVYLQF